MKFTVVLLASLVQTALSITVRSACNHDNCYRAVAGTSSGIKPDIIVRQSDCSSFMQTTVTPAPTTTTITVTAPVSPTVTPALAIRQVTTAPIAVPTYASYCSGTARYSSACSCFGITATTSYAPTPTVTTTVTVAEGCSNPQTCGSYASCGTPGGDCYCGYDTSNNAICFQSESCNESLQCETNADCVNQGANTSCLRDNCCGYSICSPTNVCQNPASKARMFKPRGSAGKRGAGCTSTGGEGC